MNPYTKELLTILKKQYTKVAGEDKQFQDTSETREFYLENLDDNLYLPMSVGAKAAYGQGSGNEIGTGKMNALRSSSAMTYNLFWDQVAELKGVCKHARLGKEIYQVELEKQYYTLKRSASRSPANLDAFLYCKHTQEAIACEMKMTEWIFNPPGKLRAAYLKSDNYSDPEFGRAMSKLAGKLIQAESLRSEHREYPCRMKNYDAFQMFKHTAACYNACMHEEPGRIKKLTLVNCVWTLPDVSLLSEEYREKYIAAEKAERDEFEQFKKTMEEEGVKKLFLDKGVDFDICFYTFSEFLGLFNKTENELDYLKRYTFE